MKRVTSAFRLREGHGVPAHADLLDELVNRLELRRYFSGITSHNHLVKPWETSNILAIGGADIIPSYDSYAYRTIELHSPLGIPTSASANVYAFSSRGTRIQAQTMTCDINWIGLYFPLTGSLLLNDFCHSPRGIEYLCSIWPDLVTKLSLYRRDADLAQITAPSATSITPPTITIGADPEYELFNSRGNFIRAEDVIGDRNLTAPIGVDGAGQQLELRPDYSESPKTVVENIRVLFREFADTYPYRIGVAGHHVPLGGHVHIGCGGRYEPTYDLTTLFDDFLGRPSIALSGRARGSYAHLGAYEAKSWGFEYRSTPAAIFATPSMALASLTIAQKIMQFWVRPQELTYADTPGVEDYVRLGVPKTLAETFLRGCQWKRIPACMSSWGIKMARPNHIIFRGTWSSEVRRAVIDMAAGSAIRQTGSTIVLYALDRGRGQVATIDTGGLYNLASYPFPQPEIDQHGRRCIGLPVLFRQYASGTDVDRMARIIWGSV